MIFSRCLVVIPHQEIHVDEQREEKRIRKNPHKKTVKRMKRRRTSKENGDFVASSSQRTLFLHSKKTKCLQSLTLEMRFNLWYQIEAHSEGKFDLFWNATRNNGTSPGYVKVCDLRVSSHSVLSLFVFLFL
jgi:hypothetical protein